MKRVVLTQQPATGARLRGPVKAACALLALGSWAPMLAQAQQAQPAAPDAGTLLREQPKSPMLTAPKPAATAPGVPAKSAQDTGPSILIKGFQISGAVSVPEAELQKALSPAVGQSLSLSQLQALGVLVTVYYAEQGLLARAVIPPQDVPDGIVKLQVIEGKRGKLHVQTTGERIDAARVQRFIDRRLQSGQALDMLALNDALAILNEQPGVAVRSGLAAGKTEGEVDVIVQASPKPLLNYTLGANNQGSRATGEYQAVAGLTLNNPTGSFDAASLLLNASHGVAFVRGDYSLAVGDTGLRLGANASAMHYRFTQDSLADLHGSGSARTVGLTASYPLARRIDWNATATAALDHRVLIDRTTVGETGNRHVSVLNVGVSGYHASPGSGVVRSFGANLVTGYSGQHNEQAREQDNVTRQVQGTFTKLALSAANLVPLSADWTANAALRGQFAGSNLDSSERLSLGGPTGVRAYPSSEATGDEGWLVTLSVARRFTDALSANVFVDGGYIKLNHSLWANWNAGNSAQPNDYSLAGLGLGLDWRVAPNAYLSFSVAAPVGNNPGRDIHDANIDGSSQHRPRAWLNFVAQF